MIVQSEASTLHGVEVDLCDFLTVGNSDAHFLSVGIAFALSLIIFEQHFDVIFLINYWILDESKLDNKRSAILTGLRIRLCMCKKNCGCTFTSVRLGRHFSIQSYKCSSDRRHLITKVSWCIC